MSLPGPPGDRSELWSFTCVRSPAEIRYDLTLDALRTKARASFIEGDRKISRTFYIRQSRCRNETFVMEVSGAEQ